MPAEVQSACADQGGCSGNPTEPLSYGWISSLGGLSPAACLFAGTVQSKQLVSVFCDVLGIAERGGTVIGLAVEAVNPLSRGNVQQ